MVFCEMSSSLWYCVSMTMVATTYSQGLEKEKWTNLKQVTRRGQVMELISTFCPSPMKTNCSQRFSEIEKENWTFYLVSSPWNQNNYSIFPVDGYFVNRMVLGEIDIFATIQLLAIVQNVCSIHLEYEWSH